jgi:hypothetical protein
LEDVEALGARVSIDWAPPARLELFAAAISREAASPGAMKLEEDASD